MQSKAATVEEYIKSLPKDRAEAIESIRKVIKKNLRKTPLICQKCTAL